MYCGRVFLTEEAIAEYTGNDVTVGTTIESQSLTIENDTLIYSLTRMVIPNDPNDLRRFNFQWPLNEIRVLLGLPCNVIISNPTRDQDGTPGFYLDLESETENDFCKHLSGNRFFAGTLSSRGYIRNENPSFSRYEV